jgi:methanogenic corrinoid protein MtbC1/DNA-binding XRE family transcriptional regulator
MNQNSLNHQKLLEILRSGDQSNLNQFLSHCNESGLTPHHIYIEIISPALGEIGELWSKGKLSIAEEHRCSEIIKNAMIIIDQNVKYKNSNNLKAVVACVQGETHYLGAKMFADFLVWDGWDCDFLGQDNPATTISEWILKVKPSVVALSMSINKHFDNMINTINEIQSGEHELKIILGGNFSQYEKVKLEKLGVTNIFSILINALNWIRASFLERNHSLLIEEYLLTVGKRIKQMRKTSGMNQQELADKSDLDRTYISAVENGRQNISLSVTLRIAQALNTSVEKITNQSTV